jgi:hypothetical protein
MSASAELVGYDLNRYTRALHFAELFGSVLKRFDVS